MNYKKLYEEKNDELIELRIKYKKLIKRYEKISNELLKYYIKYGGNLNGKKGRNKN